MTAQSNGAIASSHHLATEAGAAVLAAGGSAIDAGIAAAATLCVVYPNNVALGGDLVALVRSPEGEISFINATGPAPSGASLTEMRDRHGEALPARGVDTITLPGGIAGWRTLAEIAGRLDWQDRLAAAIRHAESAPVARSVGAALRAQEEMLRADPGARAVFFPGEVRLETGAQLRQPALAASLRALAANGPEEFYTGELARRWTRGLQALGSRIDLADLASYRPTVEPALSIDVLGHRVHTGRPNCQGFSLLRTLLGLQERAVLDPLCAGAADLARLFDEGNLIRAALLADPAAGIGGEQLIAATAPEGAPVPPPATGDTVGLVATDGQGWSVSLIQSLFQGFGSGILEPETGILFQNRGTAFSLDPEHPAALAPGRRPPHTLMPVLVEENGALRYAMATMGGQAQPQIHAQLLLRLLRGASPLEATSAPRWSVGVHEGHGAAPVSVESDVEAAAQTSLRDGGHPLTIVPPRTEALGHANVIELGADGSARRAASDPRSDGSAVILP